MNTLAATLATLAALTGIAAADSPAPTTTSSTSAVGSGPKDGYVAVNGLIGAQRAAHIGGAIELGVRAKDSVVFAHVLVAAGDSGFSADGGSFKQIRVGAEARVCIAHDVLCAFGGVDAGFQDDHPVSREWILGGDIMSTEAQDLMLVPRIGTEIGNTVKLRTTLEVPLYTRLDEPESGYGVTGMAGLAVAF